MTELKNVNQEVAITKLGNFNSLEEATSWAIKMIDSGLLPDSIETPEAAIAIVQHGKELGITPHVALQNIHVIQGRPTLSSSIIGSLLKIRGIEWTWEEDFVNIVGEDKKPAKTPNGSANRKTTIHFYWKSSITERLMETEFSVTWAQMEIAG